MGESRSQKKTIYVGMWNPFVHMILFISLLDLLHSIREKCNNSTLLLCLEQEKSKLCNLNGKLRWKYRSTYATFLLKMLDSTNSAFIPSTNALSYYLWVQIILVQYTMAKA